MLVAKKQCGGILKIEQPDPTGTQRDIVVGRRPHAHTRATPSPGVTCSPYVMLPPLVCTLTASSTEPLTMLGRKQGWGALRLTFWAVHVACFSQSRALGQTKTQWKPLHVWGGEQKR